MELEKEVGCMELEKNVLYDGTAVFFADGLVGFSLGKFNAMSVQYLSQSGVQSFKHMNMKLTKNGVVMSQSVDMSKGLIVYTNEPRGVRVVYADEKGLQRIKGDGKAIKAKWGTHTLFFFSLSRNMCTVLDCISAITDYGSTGVEGVQVTGLGLKEIVWKEMLTGKGGKASMSSNVFLFIVD